jgi:hypothetical protein
MAALRMRVQRSDNTELEQQIYDSMSASLDALTKPGGRQNAETFLLMREYFSGNYIPPAGKVTTFPGNKIETAESVQPGTVGGTQNHKRPHNPFQSGSADSLDQNEVTLPDGSKFPVF